MALPPTWVSMAISEVEESDDPRTIAKAICENPHFVNAIRTGIAEYYESAQRTKETESRNGGRLICGAPTKAEMIRSKVVEAICSTEF